LTLPIAKLRWFITELTAIDHVDVIRIGTRVPVTLPQRLCDSELIDLMAAAEKIWIQTHFNHPREITPEATAACRTLVNAGMPTYLVSAAENAIVLRNYEGMMFRYAPEDKPVAEPAAGSQGVSEVLSGAGKPLVPPGSPRQARRKKKALRQVHVEVVSSDSVV